MQLKTGIEVIKVVCLSFPLNTIKSIFHMNAMGLIQAKKKNKTALLTVVSPQQLSLTVAQHPMRPIMKSRAPTPMMVTAGMKV